MHRDDFETSKTIAETNVSVFYCLKIEGVLE